MVRFHPFKAYLPNLSREESILDRVSPPYDVIEGQELTRLRGKQYNVTRVTLGGLDGSYENSSRELAEWISKRILIEDGNESFYLYRQSFSIGQERCSRVGLVGLLGLEEYGKGGIIPHEETDPKVKEDRLNLLRATFTHTESIFGLIDDWGDFGPERFEASTQKLFECRDASGTLHSISRVSDQTVTNRIADMMRGKRIVIADGHHRYETALRYSNEAPEIENRRWVLATISSLKDPGVIAFPTHRLLRVQGMKEDRVIEQTRSCFEVEHVDGFETLEQSLRITKGPALGVIFRSGNAYRIVPITYDKNDPMWQIDSFVFQKLMLKKVLFSIAIPDEIEVEYDHDILSVERKMRLGAHDMSVLLRPPDLEFLWKLAVSGRILPKKTTYFWPKIWSGFVFYRMT